MSAARPRLLVLNPNANPRTTAAMVAIAAEAAGDAAEILGMTAPTGPPLIATGPALAAAALVAAGMADAIARQKPDAVIIAAFGDPGLVALSAALAAPVVGIGEAAFRAVGEREPVAVATTTPDLAAAIDAMGRAYRPHAYRGVILTPGEPASLMANEAALRAALLEACEAAARAGVQAVIIGGGPLASAARSLRNEVQARLVEPIPEAVRLALARANHPPGR